MPTPASKKGSNTLLQTEKTDQPIQTIISAIRFLIISSSDAPVNLHDMECQPDGVSDGRRLSIEYDMRQVTFVKGETEGVWAGPLISNGHCGVCSAKSKVAGSTPRCVAPSTPSRSTSISTRPPASTPTRTSRTTNPLSRKWTKAG